MPFLFLFMYLYLVIGTGLSSNLNGKSSLAGPFNLEAAAPEWIGERSPYITFGSNKSPKECQECLESIMKECEGEGLVDWESGPFSVTGRVYTDDDMSEFQLGVYRGIRERSIIEVR